MSALLLALLVSGAGLGAPSLSCPDCLVVAAESGEDARLTLEREISLIDDRIRHLEVKWPNGALVMTVAGVVMAPLSLLVSGMFLLTAVYPDSTGMSLEAKIGFWIAFGLALVAAVTAIVGIVRGTRAVREKKQERDQLRQVREEMRRELEALGPAAALPPPPLFGTLAVRF